MQEIEIENEWQGRRLCVPGGESSGCGRRRTREARKNDTVEHARWVSPCVAGKFLLGSRARGRDLSSRPCFATRIAMFSDAVRHQQPRNEGVLARSSVDAMRSRVTSGCPGAVSIDKLRGVHQRHPHERFARG